MADLKRDMESDPQLPFELLQLMQTALDDVPPAGFSPDQWKELDARVASMVNPLLRTGFGNLGKFFSSLFKNRPKEALPPATRLRRRGYEEAESAAPTALPPPPPAPVVLPVFEETGQALESMEEMAPIVTMPVLAPVAPRIPVPLPLPVLPEPAATIEPEPATIPVGTAVAGKFRVSASVWLLVAALMAAFAAYSFSKVALRWKARKSAQAQATQTTPVVQRVFHPGLPTRSRGVMDLSEPLPSELPPQTPQTGDSPGKPVDLETKDAQGNRGFPLP